MGGGEEPRTAGGDAERADTEPDLAREVGFGSEVLKELGGVRVRGEEPPFGVVRVVDLLGDEGERAEPLAPALLLPFAPRLAADDCPGMFSFLGDVEIDEEDFGVVEVLSASLFSHIAAAPRTLLDAEAVLGFGPAAAIVVIGDDGEEESDFVGDDEVDVMRSSGDS